MVPRQASSTVDVCILGAGPHGLAAATHLLDSQPDLRLAVIDPAGEWMANWRQQFARAEITSLRSPIVHHPAPDALALRDHVTRCRLSRSGLPYDPPTTESFDSFCTFLVDEYELDNPIAGQVRGVWMRGDQCQIDLGSQVIGADHLVLAANPHTRVIPTWAWSLLGRAPDAIAHGIEVDLATADIDGRCVTIIGGGLSAAHLASGAVARGAEVHLVTRRPLESRSFDTDPGWLGPKCLARFDREADPVNRLAQARAARGGGTVPPWMRSRIDRLVRDGDLQLHDGVGVRAADIGPDGSCQLALGDHTTLYPDRVWLATGTRPDIGACRALSDLVADLPVLDGYPVTGPDLRLGHYPVYVMGRLATLALGPAAGNLWGAQRAAERISACITEVALA
jgi:cation diffusion facilitator CzcD-associated flavoprotein CzcO